MTPAWKAGWHRLTAAGGNRAIRVLVVLGLLGIALIALSEWLPTPSGGEPEAAASVMVTPAQAEAALEERITALLSEVEGVGSCRVMVTLEQEQQLVYAADSATTSDGAGSYTEQQQTIYVATEDGPVGLPLTSLLPTVKGVAVVCAGGDDPAVCQRVTQVVATTFHISERRVCVVPQQ